MAYRGFEHWASQSVSIRKAATMVLGLIGDQVLGVNWVVGSTPTSSASC